MQRLVCHEVAESHSGPSKLAYELTDQGRECLGKWAATLDQYHRDIAKLVKILRKAEAVAQK
jgi:DNA-binding PadR family transcriptional regulator